MNKQIEDRILNSMEELACQKGFAGTTTSELASKAGISKRTLYRYFNSKEQVIEYVIYRLTSTVEKSISEIVEGSFPAPEKLRRIAETVYENIKFMEMRGFNELQTHYPQIWKYIEEFRAKRINVMENIISEGIESGDFKQVNPRLTVTAIFSSIHNIINPRFLSTHSLTIEEAFNNLLDLFLYGITSNNG